MRIGLAQGCPNFFSEGQIRSREGACKLAVLPTFLPHRAVSIVQTFRKRLETETFLRNGLHARIRSQHNQTQRGNV